MSIALHDWHIMIYLLSKNFKLLKKYETSMNKQTTKSWYSTDTSGNNNDYIVLRNFYKTPTTILPKYELFLPKHVYIYKPININFNMLNFIKNNIYFNEV